MRGSVTELDTPVSLGTGMPTMLLDSDLATALVGAFDTVLAPVFTTIDCFDAYLDPELTPADFLPWLASWVGVALNERWTVDRQRKFVAHAVELYLWRGTVRGIAAAVEVYAGVTPEIEDNGAVGWGRQPRGDIPGDAAPRLVVRVPASDAVELDEESISRIVADAKPAHVPHTVQLVRRRRASRST
jgi:phage tail-like protein